MSDLAPVHLVVQDLYSVCDPQAAGWFESDEFQEEWFQSGDVSANLPHVVGLMSSYIWDSIHHYLAAMDSITNSHDPHHDTIARFIMSLSPFGHFFFLLSVYYVLGTVYDTQKPLNENKRKDPFYHDTYNLTGETRQ